LNDIFIYLGHWGGIVPLLHRFDDFFFRMSLFHHESALKIDSPETSSMFWVDGWQEDQNLLIK